MADRELTPVEVAPLLRGLTFDGEKGLIVNYSQRVVERSRAREASGVWVDLRGADTAEAIERLSAALRGDAGRRQGTPSFVVCSPLGSFYLGESFDTAVALKEAVEGDRDTPQGPDTLTPAAPTSQERRAADRNRVVEGKISIVTGGAQGFGEEIVRGLVDAGSLVIIADLNEEGAKRLADELNGKLNRTACLPAGVDISKEESVRAMVERVVRSVGGVDLLVSNAGVLKAGSVKELAAADFEFVTRVNYVGYFLCTKWSSRVMALQNRPSGCYYSDIIQINSKSGLEGSNKNAAYAGSKFGGIGLTQSFALELVTDNIKINSICPGNFLDGPLWSDPEKGLFVQYLRAGKVPGAKSVADVKRYYEERVPMRRGCTGADVMKAIYYVVEQTYETGQALPVTGGQVMLS